MLEDASILLSQTLLIAVPLVLAALGGTCSERSGVVNIALEGILLSGAFAAATTAYAAGNVWAGLAAATAAGLLVSLAHAYLTVTMRVDQIISGLAINLFVSGATEYGAHIVWPGSASRAIPVLPAWRPLGVDILDTLLGRPLVLLTAMLVFGIWFLMTRTVLGLRLRAVGENPAACDTLGVSVWKLRYTGVGLSGVLAGLGGAWLAFNVAQFQHGMSAGKGYIAMAAVVFGKWNPLGATLACLLFAFSESLGARLEARGIGIPGELLGTLPYVLTIVALVGVVGRARAPAALGVPYEKSGS